MYRNPSLDNASWIVTTIGALNWGSRALFGFDLVRSFFGENTFISRLVYTLVGVAGAWSLYHWISRMTMHEERAPAGFARFFGNRW
jgi:uncharacterized membrane protein YuzA (DUF378 family)